MYNYQKTTIYGRALFQPEFLPTFFREHPATVSFLHEPEKFIKNNPKTNSLPIAITGWFYNIQLFCTRTEHSVYSKLCVQCSVCTVNLMYSTPFVQYIVYSTLYVHYHRTSYKTSIGGKIKLNFALNGAKIKILIEHCQDLPTVSNTAPEPYVKTYLLDKNKCKIANSKESFKIVGVFLRRWSEKETWKEKNSNFSSNVSPDIQPCDRVSFDWSRRSFVHWYLSLELLYLR